MQYNRKKEIIVPPVGILQQDLMKLVILDRDGVINEDSDEFIKEPDEWNPIPGSLEAISRLNHAGYNVAVATNQSGLARGLFDALTLNAIHNKMHQMLAKLGGHVDAIFFCPHGPDDACECRKPKPGLYREIEKRYGLNIRNVPVIGDSKRDLDAAITVGAQPILVRTGKGANTEQSLPEDYRIPVFDDLETAVQALLNEEIG